MCFSLQIYNTGTTTVVCVSAAAEKVLNVISTSSRRAWKPRITGYVEEVVSLYNESDFRDMFRLSRKTFELLTELVARSQRNRRDAHLRGRTTVPVEKQVLLFLFFIGTSNTERQMADKFGISESTVCRAIEQMLTIIVEDLQMSFIRWSLVPMLKKFN
jgi:hypothetical protein